MKYDELKVWRDTLALLLRVSKLGDVLESDGGSVGDFAVLKADLVEALTSVFHANERPDAAPKEIASAIEHVVRAKVWIRVLTETHIISRFIYQQLYTNASSILSQLHEWQEGG